MEGQGRKMLWKYFILPVICCIFWYDWKNILLYYSNYTIYNKYIEEKIVKIGSRRIMQQIYNVIIIICKINKQLPKKQLLKHDRVGEILIRTVLAASKNNILFLLTSVILKCENMKTWLHAK